MSRKQKNKILLGVTGCIAVYKVVSLVRKLVKNNFEVKVIMTDAAKEFVTPLTFKTISQNMVYSDLFLPEDEWSPMHVSLADWADIMVIAPASANTIAKIAYGLSDNLLSSTVLTFTGNILVVPSMNHNMYLNEIFQDNLDKLRKIKRFTIMEPEEGLLACGTSGKGRLPEPDAIYEEILKLV